MVKHTFPSIRDYDVLLDNTHDLFSQVSIWAANIAKNPMGHTLRGFGNGKLAFQI